MRVYYKVDIYGFLIDLCMKEYVLIGGTSCKKCKYFKGISYKGKYVNCNNKSITDKIKLLKVIIK